jgi:hypothetical protein
LKGSGHPEFTPFVRRDPCDVFALEDDLSGVGKVVSCDQVKVSAFPGPIRTDDGMNVSLMNIQGHFIDGPKFSEILYELFGLQK